MDTKHLKSFRRYSAPTGATALLFSLLIAVSAPAARADGCAGTECITRQTNYEGFEDALLYPNATGQVSFKGFEGFKSNDTQGEDEHDQWTWTANVLDFRIPGTDQSTTVQSYDLDVPLNYDIYDPGLARNMCTTVFQTISVPDLNLDADSDEGTGDCGDAFSDDEIEAMDKVARDAVGYDQTPCSALLSGGQFEAWFAAGWCEKRITTTGHFAPNGSEPVRNSTTVSRHLFSTEEHDADNTTAFETAIKEVQPIFMLSYPAVWNDSMSTDSEDLIESRLLCLYVTDVPEGYSNPAATLVVKPLLTALWCLVVVHAAAFMFS